MRNFMLFAVIFLLTACKALGPIIIENGPVVVRSGVSVGVQWALADQHTSKDDTTHIAGYLADAKALIGSGQAPAHALDDLASFLNEKISNAVVRSAIQYGIEMVKANITLPADGVIGEKAKVWVYAVLDGASDGCAAYIAGIAAPKASASTAPNHISFR